MKHISTQKQIDSYQAHCVHLPPTSEMCVCFSDIYKKKKKEVLVHVVLHTQLLLMGQCWPWVFGEY